MPPWNTELQKLNCRHFNTGTVPYLLAVQGWKVLEHFPSHRCQWLLKLTHSWCYIQDRCSASKLPQGHSGGRRKCASFQQNEWDKIRAPNGPSNVFQILGGVWKWQQAVHSQCKNPELASPFRTTTTSKNTALMTATTKQAKPVHAHIFPVQNTSWSGPQAPSTHVHKLPQQVLKPRDLLALRKVQHPHNGRTSVNRLPLTKQEILSLYSNCFEGIGKFPGEPYKFYLKPEHKPARHAPRKVPVHLEDAFKEEIKSLVELGILEEVTEYTDWVNSYVLVEKDTSSHHAPNHTIKRKLRVCLDSRDLNEALEREPYHICSVDEITAKL